MIRSMVRTLATALVLWFSAAAVVAAPAQAEAPAAADPGSTSFIGCPIYRDTDAGRKSGCWLVDDPATGVRYDVSLAPTLPQVGYEVLIEGMSPQSANTGEKNAQDQQAQEANACGGVVLRPVRTAVIATQCAIAQIPAEGYPGRRYVLPADVMQQSWVPRPAPPPPYSTQQYVLLFNFGDDRLIYQYAENIIEHAVSYAKASGASVHVSGYAATQTLVVSGQSLSEPLGLAKSRAEMVAEALTRLGIARSLQKVDWHGAAAIMAVPGAALPEVTRRRVVITLEPGHT
jgi:outer membrane protein OmpA-like peptidoglycan-associated protein